MATRKPQSSKSKPKPQQRASTPQEKPRLENLAARPSYDDMLDEQLVDHSGVFRVTTQLARAQQTGREESTRFPNDSLVMAAQRDGFREEGPTLDEAVEEHTIVDEAARAERKSRLSTLAARARQQAQARQQKRR